MTYQKGSYLLVKRTFYLPGVKLSAKYTDYSRYSSLYNIYMCGCHHR
jgi:hypothetical protein